MTMTDCICVIHIQTTDDGRTDYVPVRTAVCPLLSIDVTKLAWLSLTAVPWVFSHISVSDAVVSPTPHTHTHRDQVQLEDFT